MSDGPPATADSITLSFLPADDRTAAAMDASSYRRYLRRAHRGAVSVGDEWVEFVNCGCGITREVTLRVESFTGGGSMGEDTSLVFEPCLE
ncbi:MAG: hypothetical protein ABEJ42_06280 [Halobacteriaceae archaeon]